MWYRFLSVLLLTFSCQAELSKEQRLADFRQLADVIAKKYAPYEWKRDSVKFDALAIAPWLRRIEDARSDLDYFEICAEYFAKLEDGHTFFILPSTFTASLGFSVDLFEGKVLIDQIDRRRLPEADFPIQIGDEVISFDGKTVDTIMRDFLRFTGEGNPVTARRAVASLLTFRDQSQMPRAHEIPDESAIQIKSKAGETKTYNMTWTKTGLPVTSIPYSPPVKLSAAMQRSAEDLNEPVSPFQARTNWKRPERQYITGIGSTRPVFDLPVEGYLARIGADPSDRYSSGIFTVGETKIGFLRVPAFSSQSTFTQMHAEIRNLRNETQGLILDLMRNPGGSVCIAESLLSALIPDPFPLLLDEIRIEWVDVFSQRNFVETLKRRGAPAEEIARQEELLAVIEDAVKNNRPRTRALPLCGFSTEGKPITDRDSGEVVAYNKPMIVLVDEFTASASEVVAAVLQDTGRAAIVGMRTAGAGGAVLNGPGGIYSESGSRLTWTMGIRNKQISTPEYPTAPLIENIGVRPDMPLEINTVDNLNNKGKPFLTRVLEIAAEKIKAAQ
jgi:hypothetical protein